jgi:hypothetical protein
VDALFQTAGHLSALCFGLPFTLKGKGGTGDKDGFLWYFAGLYQAFLAKRKPKKSQRKSGEK